MCCYVFVTMTAAVQTAGGEEGEEGERQEEEEGGGRDTVTCRRTHMVLPQRSADHRGSPNLSLSLTSFILLFQKKNSVFIFFFSPRILAPPAAHCRSDLGR